MQNYCTNVSSNITTVLLLYFERYVQNIECGREFKK